MTYLDVSPMVWSFRAAPEDFDMKGPWLRHKPSRHCFRFEPDGHVTLRAGCDCAYLAIRPEQESELKKSHQEWIASYWRPLEINREFASHFRPRSALRRWALKVTGAIARRLRGDPLGAYPLEVLFPAE